MMENIKGFSLVELLVVITIIGILGVSMLTVGPSIIDKAKVSACQENLRQIGFHLCDSKFLKKAKKQKLKGIRLLLELTKGSERSGKIALVSGKATSIFICPGTDDDNYSDEAPDTPGSAYFNLDNLDSWTISYAGRDLVNFPLSKDDAGDDAVLAADDNEDRANHRSLTNYLTLGRAIDSVDFMDFIEDLPQDINYLPVGPDSPWEPFTKLIVD